MALPASGPLWLSQIAAEFGGALPHWLSEYYGAASGVPTSGPLWMSDFYGKSASVQINMSAGAYTFQNVDLKGNPTGNFNYYRGFNISDSIPFVSPAASFGGISPASGPYGLGIKLIQSTYYSYTPGGNLVVGWYSPTPPSIQGVSVPGIGYLSTTSSAVDSQWGFYRWNLSQAQAAALTSGPVIFYL